MFEEGQFLSEPSKISHAATVVEQALGAVDDDEGKGIVLEGASGVVEGIVIELEVEAAAKLEELVANPGDGLPDEADVGMDNMDDDELRIGKLEEVESDADLEDTETVLDFMVDADDDSCEFCFVDDSTRLLEEAAPSQSP